MLTADHSMTTGESRGRIFSTRIPGLFCLTLLVFFINIHPVSGTNIPGSQKALQQVQAVFPNFTDDLAFKHLALAIRRNIDYLKRLSPQKTFAYGPHRFTCRQVLESQEAFLRLISKGLSEAQFNRRIRKQFRIYRAAGQVGSNKVLFTGYYAPEFDAVLKRNEKFKYPLYKSPKDLVRIDLSRFNAKFKGERIIARVSGNKVLPYYTRHQIEIEKALHGKRLEIAWLKDPMDVYLLHIEGAGRLRLSDGSVMNVNCSASNGRPYRSFGRYLLNRGYLTPGELSVSKIRRYLSKNQNVFNEILGHNDSYTFFKKVKHGPLGNINVPLTVGRSLALDAGLFPKGALAFISSRKPTMNRLGRITGWRDFSRFVLNQDTGSAIKGAGRADLFWGSGPGAETAAWSQKHDGDLYVLIQKR
jgi:membrane-bound lytic murein transglycosylase A